MDENLIIADVYFVHKEHKDWMGKLNFYQDEIKFFQNELYKVVQENEITFNRGTIIIFLFLTMSVFYKYQAVTL